MLMLSPLALAWQLVGKWVVVMGREKRGSDDDTKAMLRYEVRLRRASCVTLSGLEEGRRQAAA